MTTKRLVYTRPDGGVTIECLSSGVVERISMVRHSEADIAAFVVEICYCYDPNPDGSARPLTEEDRRRLGTLLQSSADDETVAVELCKMHVIPPTATNLLVCDYADLYPPTKSIDEARRFRRTWRQGGSALPHVDLPLARAQRAQEIRAERDRKLQQSDGPMFRAQERGGPSVQGWEDYRQALRDLPATQFSGLETIQTPEALDAWTPTWPAEPTA